MGDKIRSKIIAEKANVKHIPGFVGAINDEKHLLEVANQIGYALSPRARARACSFSFPRIYTLAIHRMSLVTQLPCDGQGRARRWWQGYACRVQ
jgi:hypothetical protein